MDSSSHTRTWPTKSNGTSLVEKHLWVERRPSEASARFLETASTTLTKLKINRAETCVVVEGAARFQDQASCRHGRRLMRRPLSVGGLFGRRRREAELARGAPYSPESLVSCPEEGSPRGSAAVHRSVRIREHRFRIPFASIGTGRGSVPVGKSRPRPHVARPRRPPVTPLWRNRHPQLQATVTARSANAILLRGQGSRDIEPCVNAVTALLQPVHSRGAKRVFVFLTHTETYALVRGVFVPPHVAR
jgi:hypothetical protein